MSANLNSLNDKQNSLLNRLSYIDINDDWEKGDNIVTLLRRAGATSNTGKDAKNEITELAEEFEKYGLADLKIVGYENDNGKTGFCAIAFKDLSGAVGMSYRGTEGMDDLLNNPTDMIDNLGTSTIGISPQSVKSLAFYEKYKDRSGNNYLYGHSKGGDLAMEVFVTNYSEIKKAHIINAQPIDDSKLELDQKDALFSGKVDAIIIDGDIVGMLGIPGYPVRYIKNNGSQSGFFGPHGIKSASIDNGNYVNETNPFNGKYIGQKILATSAAVVVEAIQIRTSITSHIINRAIRVYDFIVNDLPEMASKTIEACKKGIEKIAGATKKAVEAVGNFLSSVAESATNWWNNEKAKITKIGKDFMGEMFGKDILIDEEAFIKASDDLGALSERLKTLRADIVGMLNTLKKGFDTPAGTKFYNSCYSNLLKPLDDQKLVLDHVSQVLKTAKTQYQSVFDAYANLNNSISNYSG